MYFSMKIRPSPKELIASSYDNLKPSAASLSLNAILIPLPPPPADALIITGYPISLAILKTS
jgi:hypothetical protein